MIKIEDDIQKLFIELYKALEDDNEHTDTAILACLYNQNYDDIKLLCDIAIQHEKEGSLSPENDSERYKIYKRNKDLFNVEKRK